MTNRKRPPVVAFALAGFYQVKQRPSFAMYRTVDIVQLLGCGVCIGVAMVGVIASFVSRR